MERRSTKSLRFLIGVRQLVYYNNDSTQKSNKNHKEIKYKPLLICLKYSNEFSLKK